MRILLLGAYGFIGSAIARRLLDAGHLVIGIGRDVAYGLRVLPAVQWRAIDLSQMTNPEKWQRHLEGVEVIVNAAGLLQGGDGGSLRSVHVDSIAALVQAASQMGVRQFVQISAAGADLDAPTDFMRTKAEADMLLLKSSVPTVILRPGLVIGRNSYGGTELIRSVAAAPVRWQLPLEATIQCVALSDVADAVSIAISRGFDLAQPIDLVEERARTLAQIVACHREWLGLYPTRHSIRVPAALLSLVAAIADLLGHLGWRPPLRRNAIMSLRQGVRGDFAMWAQLLGRNPLTLEQALSASPAGKQDRIAARLSLLLPAILGSLTLMWLASGLATFVRLPDAQALVEGGGLTPATARGLAVTGAFADVVLGLAILWRRTVRPALLGMILLTGAYLLGATMLLPHLWTDPLAPLVKTLPAAVLALIAFWLVEKR